jgi:hypothetical protein
MIAFICVALAAWFGFELGRKWTEGQEEEVLEEAIEARERRPGVRLNRVVVRR